MKKTNFPKLDFSFMEPYRLQREIIEHPAKYKIVSFGRQSGKSWLGKRILLEQAANFGKRCWFVSPTIPTALDHWDELLELIEDSNIPIAGRNRSTKTVRFLSGGTIRIRSAEIPKNLRGSGLHYIILDEAAYMPQQVWYNVLQPTITASRGKVLFLSTPFGQNWFYDLFMLGQSNDPLFSDFASWAMPSTEAPYQDQEALQVIKRTIPSLVWREEYMAEFLADAGGVFAGLEKVPYFEPYDRPRPGQVYVAGIDIGLDNDSSVFTVAEKYNGQQVYGERFTTVGTEEQIDRFAELIRLWSPEVTHVEMNGIGRPMFKIMKKRLMRGQKDDGSNDFEVLGMGGQRTRVRGVWLNNPKKRKLIERVAGAIEYGRFKPLVRRDPADVTSYGAIQISEMSTFRRTKTSSGLEVSYGAADGSHDDTVMGLAHMYAGIEGEVWDDEEEPEIVTAKKVRRSGRKSPFQNKKAKSKNEAPRGSMSRRHNRRRRDARST